MRGCAFVKRMCGKVKERERDRGSTAVTGDFSCLALAGVCSLLPVLKLPSVCKERTALSSVPSLCSLGVSLSLATEDFLVFVVGA